MVDIDMDDPPQLIVTLIDVFFCLFVCTVLKQEQPSPVVTKEFCLEVLMNVANRQPPYFLDGHFTGECRKSLVDQCGDLVCEWAKLYKDAAPSCPGCPSSCDAEAPVS